VSFRPSLGTSTHRGQEDRQSARHSTGTSVQIGRPVERETGPASGHDDSCNGLIFRAYLHNSWRATGDIESRAGLRLQHSLSCQGCPNCAKVDRELTLLYGTIPPNKAIMAELGKV